MNHEEYQRYDPPISGIVVLSQNASSFEGLT